jgi:hypothetical protein
MEKKKYKVIAKVNDNKFVKYNVNNLLLFTNFLDENFNGWRWFNVYEYNREGNGRQIGSFTNKKRPLKRFI